MALTADIIIAYVGNKKIATAGVPGVIACVHGTLTNIATPGATAPEEALKPAISIRASIKPDYLVCLEDGKQLKMLKRHLMVHFGLTPEAYRAKWTLPADYPMVAPNYAARRSEIATQSGLGKTGRSGRKNAPAVNAS